MKNLITRSITGILFVAVMIGAITASSPVPFCILFTLITALTVWEFTGIVNAREDVEVNRLITTVAGTYLFLAMFGDISGLMSPVGFAIYVPYLLSLVYLFISELYLQRPNAINNWAYSMLPQLYIALPFALLNVLYFTFAKTDATVDGTLLSYSGRWLVLAVFVFLWCNDTGAYCVGSLIGRHKLFPRVSPGKTWEGSVGGGVVSIAVSQVFAHFIGLLTPVQWAAFALVVVVFGTWGDLVESLFKRQLGIKDSGKILPGHGGMLDRFDSSLMAIPAVVMFLCMLSLM